MSFHYQLDHDAITIFQLQTKQKHSFESMCIITQWRKFDGLRLKVDGLLFKTPTHVTPGNEKHGNGSKPWEKLRSYCEHCSTCVLRRAIFFRPCLVQSYDMKMGLEPSWDSSKKELGILGEGLFNLIVFFVFFSVGSKTPLNTPPKTKGRRLEATNVDG